MVSPLSAALDQVTETWEALTPPTDAELIYQEVDGRSQLQGSAGHRTFEWLLPQRSEPVLEAGSVATHVTWEVQVRLRLEEAGQGRRAFIDSVLTESNLLARAIEKATSWPSGVIHVQTDGVDIERDDTEYGDALVTLNLRITCAETD